MKDGRLRDVLWMTVAIQLSVFAAIIPDLFPLVLASILLTLNAIVNEGIRWLDAYSEQ